MNQHLDSFEKVFLRSQQVDERARVEREAMRAQYRRAARRAALRSPMWWLQTLSIGLLAGVVVIIAIVR